MSPSDFQKHYLYTETMAENGVAFIPPALRSAWADNVDTSFMVYNKKIEYDKETLEDSSIVPFMNLEEPRTQLQNAKCAADEVVWFYLENEPEARWYYAIPQDWREEVLLPALEYQCPAQP
jgi:hypothetical protein